MVIYPCQRYRSIVTCSDGTWHDGPAKSGQIVELVCASMRDVLDVVSAAIVCLNTAARRALCVCIGSCPAAEGDGGYWPVLPLALLRSRLDPDSQQSLQASHVTCVRRSVDSGLVFLLNLNFFFSCLLALRLSDRIQPI